MAVKSLAYGFVDVVPMEQDREKEVNTIGTTTVSYIGQKVLNEEEPVQRKRCVTERYLELQRDSKIRKIDESTDVSWKLSGLQVWKKETLAKFSVWKEDMFIYLSGYCYTVHKNNLNQVYSAFVRSLEIASAFEEAMEVLKRNHEIMLGMRGRIPSPVLAKFDEVISLSRTEQEALEILFLRLFFNSPNEAI